MRGMPKKLGTKQDLKNICMTLDPDAAMAVLDGLTEDDAARMRATPVDLADCRKVVEQRIRVAERKAKELEGASVRIGEIDAETEGLRKGLADLLDSVTNMSRELNGTDRGTIVERRRLALDDLRQLKVMTAELDERAGKIRTDIREHEARMAACLRDVERLEAAKSETAELIRKSIALVEQTVADETALNKLAADKQAAAEEAARAKARMNELAAERVQKARTIERLSDGE